MMINKKLNKAGLMNGFDAWITGSSTGNYVSTGKKWMSHNAWMFREPLGADSCESIRCSLRQLVNQRRQQNPSTTNEAVRKICGQADLSRPQKEHDRSTVRRVIERQSPSAII